MEAFQRFPTSLSPSRSWAWDLQFVEMRSANPAEKPLEIYAIAAIPDRTLKEYHVFATHHGQIWRFGVRVWIDAWIQILVWNGCLSKKKQQKWSPSWMQYFEAKYRLSRSWWASTCFLPRSCALWELLRCHCSGSVHGWTRQKLISEKVGWAECVLTS